MTSADVKIIRAELQHASLLAELGATTFDETFRGTCTDKDLEGLLAEYYNEEQVRKELADTMDFFFLLFVGERVAGYSRINLGRKSLAAFSDKPSAELMRIYFLKSYHGTGLAAQLLNYCFDFLRTKGFEQVYLSVWEHNERAKAFYTKHGFINSGIQNPFPIGETPQMDYWYVKQL